MINFSSLNFEPFTFTNNKGYFITDNADLDDNFYKHNLCLQIVYIIPKNNSNTNLLARKKKVPTFL